MSAAVSSTSCPHQVADGVFMFTGTDVNWVLLQEGTDLTLIDAGWPGDTHAVERSIRSLGRRPEDLRAVLLTHAHADHTGALNHLHDSYGVPVHMAAAEVPNALGEHVETAGALDMARFLDRLEAVRWMARVIRAGGLEHRTTPSAAAFPASADHGALDLPGGPVPIPTPGHTSGHTSYLLPDSGTVVTGDALVSGHPTLRTVGPQLLPAAFAHDQGQTVDALHALHDLAADALLPGHGQVWRGAISDAVDQALARAEQD